MIDSGTFLDKFPSTFAPNARSVDTTRGMHLEAGDLPALTRCSCNLAVHVGIEFGPPSVDQKRLCQGWVQRCGSSFKGDRRVRLDVKRMVTADGWHTSRAILTSRFGRAML